MALHAPGPGGRWSAAGKPAIVEGGLEALAHRRVAVSDEGTSLRLRASVSCHHGNSSSCSPGRITFCVRGGEPVLHNGATVTATGLAGSMLLPPPPPDSGQAWSIAGPHAEERVRALTHLTPSIWQRHHPGNRIPQLTPLAQELVRVARRPGGSTSRGPAIHATKSATTKAPRAVEFRLKPGAGPQWDTGTARGLYLESNAKIASLRLLGRLGENNKLSEC